MLKKNLIKKIIFSLIFGFITLSETSQAKIITSVKPIGFISAAISDNVTETEILLPDGASSHSYSLKPADLVNLKSAELVVWIGQDMEVFLANMLKRVDPNKQIELTQLDPIIHLLQQGHAHEHEENEELAHNHHDHHDSGKFNEHIWLSPQIAKEIAIVIHSRLIKRYPEKKIQLDQNLRNFVKNLSETEQIIAKELKSVQNSGYFVFHDAYGYFEEQFQLNHLGSFTINPSVQPGLKRIYEIQKELKAKQAICVFTEPQFSPSIVAKLVDNTNVKVGTLDPLGMDIPLSKNSYNQFLYSLAQQFLACLAEK